MIGEEYHRAYYTDCFQCSFQLCPIRKIIGILRYVAPKEMREVEAEIQSLPTTAKSEVN